MFAQVSGFWVVIGWMVGLACGLFFQWHGLLEDTKRVRDEADEVLLKAQKNLDEVLRLKDESWKARKKQR